ncbi:hypothetical protein T439DRAFT_203225 [Meredithblackwellia eburnea MCA 4105]
MNLNNWLKNQLFRLYATANDPEILTTSANVLVMTRRLGDLSYEPTKRVTKVVVVLFLLTFFKSPKLWMLLIAGSKSGETTLGMRANSPLFQRLVHVGIPPRQLQVPHNKQLRIFSLLSAIKSAQCTVLSSQLLSPLLSPIPLAKRLS